MWRLAGVCGTDAAGVLDQEGLKGEVPSRLHDRVEKKWILSGRPTVPVLGS